MSRVGLIVPTTLERSCIGIPADPAGRPDYVAVSGMGKVNAALSAARAILYEECDALVLAGFCGGLDGVELGQDVHAADVIEGDFDAGILDLKTRFKRVAVPAGMPGVPAIVLTTDKFMKTRPAGTVAIEKPWVCDMEAWAVMKACEMFGARFACVRVVSDIVGVHSEKDFVSACETLAPELHKACAQAVAAVRRLIESIPATTKSRRA